MDTIQLSPLDAANPEYNATVSASAGTGKTWMLTTRIIRLLLSGATPCSILAITFTRKAAAEMRERINSRLSLLAHANGDEIHKLLKELGEPCNEKTIKQAQTLHDNVLSQVNGVQVMTFHSFCQDLLRRFPLEADIPAGFELLDNASLVMDAAWENINKQALADQSSRLSTSLLSLFESFGTLATTKKVLYDFVQQRSDWWAYTAGQDTPTDWAINQLKSFFDFDENSLEKLSDVEKEIQIFTQQLQKRKSTKTIEKQLAQLALSLSPDLKQEERYHLLCDVFLTAAFVPRSFKLTKTMQNDLSDEADAHVHLFEEIAQTLLNIREHQLRKKAYEINSHWYLVGQALVAEYQRLKQQRKQLDFTDLEWFSYQLLHHGDNAHWVQFKLDQRIDHLLFDEFQDTNPTQWQLVKPLLEELSSGEREKPRSVFLVGDTKQSIYSFRRANPELQVQASHWLQTSLDAKAIPLNLSRRSASTIMEMTNILFSDPSYADAMPNFGLHDTFEKSLWGRVELHPLFTSTSDNNEKEIRELRNPLTTPRVFTQRDHHLKEGRFIADKIASLIEQGLQVTSGGKTRPIQYNDIFILFKSRSHVSEYEKALKEKGIPFIGTEKGTFLDNMEIQDMEAILNFLNMPFDNHRLAVILRSPIFHVSTEDLSYIATIHPDEKNWWRRLQLENSQTGLPFNLHDAFSTLSRWMDAASHLPVHDLIDKIFYEGDVFNAYQQVVSSEHQEQVKANLIHFIEMALNIDSGRYPSLTRFLDQLKRLRNRENKADKPDNAQSSGSEEKVSLLTVHASKGLEAPVVFLADTFNSTNDKLSNEAFVEWPSDKDRPTNFLLVPKKDERTQCHQILLEDKKLRDDMEEANLLYVAITRAKHMLIISGGCKEEDFEKGSNWYSNIKNIMSSSEKVIEEENQVFTLSNGTPLYSNREFKANPQAKDHNTQFKWDKAIAPPIKFEIAPSSTSHRYNSKEEQDPDGMERGIYIHQLLENFSSPNANNLIPTNALSKNVTEECVSEVQALLNNNSLQWIFDSNQSIDSKKEVGITYQTKNKKQVYGIIDRLVITEDEVWIIDYKSHQHATIENMHEIAEAYINQMAYYKAGVEKIYTDKTIRSALLFTHIGQTYEMNLE